MSKTPERERDGIGVDERGVKAFNVKREQRKQKQRAHLIDYVSSFFGVPAAQDSGGVLAKTIPTSNLTSIVENDIDI